MSDFFKTCITSGFKESDSRNITIENANEEILHKLLDSLYTGDINILDEELIEIISLIDILGIKHNSFVIESALYKLYKSSYYDMKDEIIEFAVDHNKKAFMMLLVHSLIE